MKPIPLRVAKGRRIPRNSIARVDVQGMWEKDETPETASAWLLTPSNDLLGRKRLTAAHSLLPGPRPTVAYVANFTDRDTWIPKNARIGFIECAKVMVEEDDAGGDMSIDPEQKILLTSLLPS